MIAEIPHPSRSMLPEPFATTTPPGISSFLLFLASRETDPRTGKAGKSAVPPDLSASRAFLRPLESIFASWPAGFGAHVRKRLRAGDHDLQSAPARLGYWYQGLMRFREDAYAPFRECLATVIADEFEGAYRGAAAADSGRRAAWLSAAEADRLLSVRAERIVEAVASGAVAGRLHHSGIGHRHCTLKREAVDAIADNRRRYGDARAVTAMLGISRNQMSLLTEAGVVCAASTRPPLVDGAFNLDTLMRDIEAIRERAILRPGRRISFREINLRRTTDRGAILEILRSIFGSWPR
jgi:hypothetical protein